MTKKTSTQDQNLARDISSSAHEDYLKAIYTLLSQSDKATNSTLAKYMKVSSASATNMVKKLAELNLVEYEPYQSIMLTKAGEQIALEMLRHHRLLELYLHQALNIPWDQVHEEADKLEHVISESVEDAIADALGNPTFDPHGDPIPTKGGHVETVGGTSLNQAEQDQPYQLLRVLAQDQRRLEYLGTLGLYPDAQIIIRGRAPFEGPLDLDVNGERQILAHNMAELLLVKPLTTPTKSGASGS